MTVAPDSPRTCAGVSRRARVVPSPSFPLVLSPQQRPVPSVITAQVKKTPAVIAVAPDRPATLTGDNELIRVPFPSCPVKFAPQQRAVPSLSTAQVWAG